MRPTTYTQRAITAYTIARYPSSKRAVHASAKRPSREPTSDPGSSEIMSDMEFEAIINDQDTMANLRKKLLGQMKAAAAQEQLEAASELAPFDSDEYDYAEVDRVNPPNGSKPSTARKARPGPDSYAEEAAARLAAASSDILDVLDPQHAHKAQSSTHARDGPAKTTKPRSIKATASSPPTTTTTTSSSSSKSRGNKSGSSQSNSSSSTNSKAGGSSSKGSGSSSSSSGDTGGGSSSSKDFPIPATAIGRVAESLGNIPVAVLKKGKARLFEAGSPMVSGVSFGWG